MRSDPAVSHAPEMRDPQEAVYKKIEWLKCRRGGFSTAPSGIGTFSLALEWDRNVKLC